MYKIILPDSVTYYEGIALDEREALALSLPKAAKRCSSIAFPTEECPWVVQNLETPEQRWVITNVAQIGDILSKLKAVLKSAFIHV